MIREKEALGIGKGRANNFMKGAMLQRGKSLAQ